VILQHLDRWQSGHRAGEDHAPAEPAGVGRSGRGQEGKRGQRDPAAQRSMATPHGPLPALMVATTFRVAVSMTDTVSDTPSAA
jgi:hypothetical protein